MTLSFSLVEPLCQEPVAGQRHQPWEPVMKPWAARNKVCLSCHEININTLKLETGKYYYIYVLTR